MGPIVMCVVNNLNEKNISSDLDFLFNNYQSTFLNKVESKTIGLLELTSGKKLNNIIDDEIKNRTFFENLNLNYILNDVSECERTLHLVGALNRNSFNYLVSLLEGCRLKKIYDVYIHLFLSHDDFVYLDKLNLVLKKADFGVISSICSLDSSKNKVYNLLVEGIGQNFNDYNQFLMKKDNFSEAIFDKDGVIKESDSVILFDLDEEMNDFFDLFNKKNSPYYIDSLEINTFMFNRKNSIFSIDNNEKIFSYLSDKGLKQLLIGIDQESLKKCRVVPTKNLDSNSVTQILLDELHDRNYDFVFVYYNDSYNIEKNLNKILDYVNDNSGMLVLTTCYGDKKIPFLITSNEFTLNSGRMSDVAPTVLDLLGLSKTSSMVGHSLLSKPEIKSKRKIKKSSIFMIASIVFIVSLTLIYTCRFFYYKSREDKLLEISDRSVL